MLTPEVDCAEGEIERQKKGFTRRQKKWIKEAYAAILGFSGCVFPVWNEELGDYEYCRKAKTHVHHIRPRGWCIRVLGLDPNIAINGAPICEEHHINGQRDRPLTRETQDVIHLDIVDAKRRYRGDSALFDKVMDQRSELCGEAIPYWFQLWDRYLSELAEDVVAEYQRRFPFHLWPKRKVTRTRG